MPPQLLVTNLTYDDYKGKIILGRLSGGTLRRLQPVLRIDREGATFPERIAQVFIHEGLERIEVEEVDGGRDRRARRASPTPTSARRSPTRTTRDRCRPSSSRRPPCG